MKKNIRLKKLKSGKKGNDKKVWSQEKRLFEKISNENKIQQENLSMMNMFYWAQKKYQTLKSFIPTSKIVEEKKSQNENFKKWKRKWKGKSHKIFYCISIILEN